MRFSLFLLLLLITLTTFAQNPLLVPRVDSTLTRRVLVQPPGTLTRILPGMVRPTVKTTRLRLPFASRMGTVRYVVGARGDMIIDGDILLGKEAAVLRSHANRPGATWGPRGAGANPGALTATRDDGLLWRNGRIPYTFDRSWTAGQRQAIQGFLRELSEQTVLTVEPRTARDRDYIVIVRTAAGDPAGGYSYVGRQGGEQQLQINPTSITRRTTIHEFLHAAGVYHEQSRPDRDRYLTVHWDRMRDEFEYAMDIHEGAKVLTSTYDYCSIMHYPGSAFPNQQGQVTLEPKLRLPSGCTLGRKTLSALDVEGLAKLYWESGEGNLATDLPTNVSAHQITTGDLDADGADEIVVATTATSGPRIYVYDDADHGYAPLAQIGADYGNGIRVTGVDIGNWRGVGQRDLVVTRTGTNVDNVLIYGYDNTMKFTHPFPRTGAEWGEVYANRAVFVDLDLDGTDELAVSRNQRKKGYVRLMVFDRGNTGQLEEMARITNWGNGIYGGALTAGDLTGDGVPELAIARLGDFSNRPKYEVYQWMDGELVQLMAGGSDWSSKTHATDLAIGRLDGSGSSQLLMTRNIRSAPYPRFVAYRVSDPNGSAPITPFGNDWSGNTYGTCLAAADLDGNGSVEVALGQSRSGVNNVEVRDDYSMGYAPLLRFGEHLRANTNAPSSRWSSPTVSRSSASYPTDMCWGDVDGDGQLELVVGLSINLAGFPRVVVREVEGAAW